MSQQLQVRIFMVDSGEMHQSILLSELEEEQTEKSHNKFFQFVYFSFYPTVRTVLPSSGLQQRGLSTEKLKM